MIHRLYHSHQHPSTRFSGRGKRSVGSRGIAAAAMIGVSTLFIFGILFVILANDLSTKAYEVRSLHRRLDSLSSEMIRLKQETAREQSRTQLVERFQRYPFVAEGSVEYARDASVALGMPLVK